MSGIAVRVLSTRVERSLPLLSAPDGVIAYVTWNAEARAACVGREESRRVLCAAVSSCANVWRGTSWHAQYDPRE